MYHTTSQQFNAKDANQSPAGSKTANFVPGIAIFRFANANTYWSAQHACALQRRGCHQTSQPCTSGCSKSQYFHPQPCWVGHRMKPLIWKKRNDASSEERMSLSLDLSWEGRAECFCWGNFIFCLKKVFLVVGEDQNMHWQMDVVIQIVPGDVSPLGISVKVTFASLQNYNTEIFCWVAEHPTGTLGRGQGEEHGCPSKPHSPDDSRLLGWHPARPLH